MKYELEGSRIPVEVNGIQVNFCKNPRCPNFGSPASTGKQPKGPGSLQRGGDGYAVRGTSGGRNLTPCLTSFKIILGAEEHGIMACPKGRTDVTSVDYAWRSRPTATSEDAKWILHERISLDMPSRSYTHSDFGHLRILWYSVSMPRPGVDWSQHL